jgi:peptide/nickel transport system permease protein
MERLLQALLVLAGISVIAFLFTHLSGDPVAAMLPPDASQKEIDELRVLIGLDKPLYVQYAFFLQRVLHGDFGRSFRYKISPLTLVFERVPATFILTVSSLLLSIWLAIPTGILSARFRNALPDRGGMIFIVSGQSIPVFWSAMMLIMLFAVHWRLLPPSGYEGWKALVLPTVTLALHSAAEFARLLRTSMLEVLNMDYIRTARAKGIMEALLVCKHAFRNALIPLVTMIGVQFGVLMGGAVVTESIFAWPGLGRLTIEAIYSRDIPLVQACVLFFAVVITLVNLLIDLSYPFIDPRITYE